MDDPGTLETAGRLAVAGFVMVAPTLLFLGLVRALEALRDDAFIERWLTEGEHEHELEDDVLTVLADGLGVETDGASGVRCAACGTTNMPDAEYCHNCLGRLRS